MEVHEIMYELNTLKKIAKRAGFKISKDFTRYISNNAVVVSDFGNRQVGYEVLDESTGNIWGRTDLLSHYWELEEVAEFLKEEYEIAGMEF